MGHVDIGSSEGEGRWTREGTKRTQAGFSLGIHFYVDDGGNRIVVCLLINFGRVGQGLSTEPGNMPWLSLCHLGSLVPGGDDMVFFCGLQGTYY